MQFEETLLDIGTFFQKNEIWLVNGNLYSTNKFMNKLQVS